MLDKYLDYFNIDPEYFPQVNEAVMNKNPDLWKKFYPHETFVKLMKDTINVLSKKQKVSIWVEGAYGTGKSHAVLTLKKLIDASPEDTKEYFEKYSDQLSNDLYNQFQQVKSGEQKILTVHRYGSSNIHNDDNLVSAIQESIIESLKKAGYPNSAQGSLKDAAITWLSDKVNKKYFDELILEYYTDIFNGDNVDSLITKLSEYSGSSLQDLMGKIMKVGDERNIKPFKLEVTNLVDWINAIIAENNLKAIVFIWDEFTEYFGNNIRSLTGFQKIAEISATSPFYLVIVTHNVTHIFPENDSDWKKIINRFVDPICNIELPENMAFQLMGTAMVKSEDTRVLEEWEDTEDELCERTNESRKLVKTKANIDDRELMNILPIHPYAALLLKHIATVFDSNQRSMFDFIKNDRGDEIKGFQWFINNCGPLDRNPLLTIDMLWDFFYEKGKQYLSADVRSILDCFAMAKTKQLDNDQERVLKVVLLLQAISQKTGNTVELFIPDEKNLNNAFEGSDLENDEAVKIANSMVPSVLYKEKTQSGLEKYSALIHSVDTGKLNEEIENQKRKPTSDLVEKGSVYDAVLLTGALRLRYAMKHATVTDFKSTINKMRNQENDLDNRIMAVTVFAKDDIESVSLGKSIKESLSDPTYNIVFIDASLTPMGADLYNQYIEEMAQSVTNVGSNNDSARQHEKNAINILEKWKRNIENGEFVIYTKEKPNGERCATVDMLLNELHSIDRKLYPQSLEMGQAVTDTMWQSNSLASGVACGAEQATSGQFRSSNQNTKLENYIGGEAWGVENYWIDKPYLPISKIKIELEKLIQDAFTKEGRVSIAQIYDALKKEPYGFMPCNLTAFVLGFLLKEYTKDSYSYSDSVATDEMSIDKLKQMVSDIIKHNQTPIPRYKDKYIVTMTAEEKAFNNASSQIFGIHLHFCSSLTQTRDNIRNQMKGLSFPIWSLKYTLDNANVKTDKNIVIKLIDGYCGIANNANFGLAKTDSDIALEIGKMCIDNTELVNDAKLLITKENCIKGMDSYIHQYNNSELIHLASEIGDGGQYINRLKSKFDADAANWVWNVETANQKIDELLLEYKIVSESNKIQPKNISYTETIREWCDRCRFVKISYLYAKNDWNELSDLMEILYSINKSGHLMESQKQAFLTQIKLHGTEFINFYNNQQQLFRKSCGFILNKFNDDEIKEIFNMLPNNLFTDEKSNYQSTVSNAVEKFVSEQGAAKLKKLWLDKTGTASPYEWSERFATPILCMVNDQEYETAKWAFNIIGKKNAEKVTIEKAMQFFEKAEFFKKLDDKDSRDEAFKKCIIKSYDVMLSDVNEVRKYLKDVVPSKVYDWFGSLAVERKLEEMAQFKYNQSGSDKAISKIDNMDVADVKRYLKDLIRDNMTVGMEIIKDN